MRIINFIKEWVLIISILTGIAGYFLYTGIPALYPTHHVVHEAVSMIQPVLIFVMLFLTFCRIDFRDLRLRRWHLWVLALQAGFFLAIGCVVMSLPAGDLRVVLEGAMLCLVCPTATAGAVVTRKLGGNVNNITTYTILINILVAMLIPAVVPFVHPNAGMGMLRSSLLILGKVFPLLILPLAAAMLMKHFFPRLTERISRYQDLSFYLWALALALAIAVTVHSIMTAEIELSTELGLVAVSFVCCLLQFWLGRKIGARYDDTITAGQSFGQKNTVLAIWMGYTFFTPVTAIVGGFYSIWHNVINSYQLYRHDHRHDIPQTGQGTEADKIV